MAHVLIVNHHLTGAKRRGIFGNDPLANYNHLSNPKPSIPCVKRTSKLLTDENQ